MTSQVLQMFENGPLKGSGILEHLCDLMRNLLSPKNELKSLDNIEVLSYFIRTHAFKFNELLQDESLQERIQADKKYAPYLQNLASLTSKLTSLDNTQAYTTPDLEAEYQALKTTGISIGQKNYYYLSKVLRLLAVKNNVKEIRFWGKILGRKDYYVIQGISNQPYPKEGSKDSEQYGVGVNSYSYWVANNILGDWTELPLVTPAQVRASREFKYIFSGNLDQKLQPFVAFDGLEKHLLKCIIARITHSCLLVPKGLYKVGEETIEFEESEEGFKLPEVNELASLDNWVHFPPNIMLNGRTTHFIDPALGAEEAEALKAELEGQEAPTERLKGIGEDKSYENNGYAAPANWTSQQCGETIPVSLIQKQEGQSAVYGVALLKNLTWPGASTVGYRGGWTNIYIGYGQKANQETKIMKELADLQVEGVDTEERSEPNPSKPVVVEEKKDEAGEEAAGE